MRKVAFGYYDKLEIISQHRLYEYCQQVDTLECMKKI